MGEAEKYTFIKSNISLHIYVYVSGLEKLAFLVHKRSCSLKQVEENVMCLVILCCLCTCSPHRVPRCAPNEIDYENINVEKSVGFEQTFTKFIEIFVP